MQTSQGPALTRGVQGHQLPAPGALETPDSGQLTWAQALPSRKFRALDASKLTVQVTENEHQGPSRQPSVQSNQGNNTPMGLHAGGNGSEPKRRSNSGKVHVTWSTALLHRVSFLELTQEILCALMETAAFPLQIGRMGEPDVQFWTLGVPYEHGELSTSRPETLGLQMLLR